ncbi:MAG: flavin reductase family protein [Chloroflexi bacterium]|nr:flavin reductase family protein [Chloroflexota bacterium]
MKVEPGKPPNNQPSHSFFSSVVVPRPIAFVSTVNEKGQYNAAPFSAFSRLGGSVLAFGISRRGHRKKDTLANIEAVGDFVVNMVDENLAQAMNKASRAFPPEVDEIKETGLTPVKSDKVKSPRIAEAPISIECKLMQTIEVGDTANRHHTIVIGQILLYHIKDEIMTDGNVDHRKAKIIARLGGTDIYCRTTDIFEMRRPNK